MIFIEMGMNLILAAFVVDLGVDPHILGLATSWVIRPCFIYGVLRENFCVRGFSVGSIFFAGCMAIPFD
jgi:hypothetical protein